ncbi:NUDIX domain-containing protein [Natronomonas halophila]|uniref:NUDIX hydrolase n=1 Tax=Natronomonas halophila TaxID=2747817 RepID=UPI0015B5C45A|nr:NUDIX domain-containing protein [Natronomonas halophila]QLD85023.1 NUDIX domain-containing protein [Natronomonas halophila]
METTRHFVATMYAVNDGATLLHEHEKLDMWLPPGGHIDRDELPHEAALRETYEETGLEPDLVAETGPYDTEQAESLPQPDAFLLEDIDVHESGRVAHQHMDFVYFGRAESREIDPAGHDETAADAWAWFTAEELDAHDELAADICDLGKQAIEQLG